MRAKTYTSEDDISFNKEMTKPRLNRHIKEQSYFFTESQRLKIRRILTKKLSKLTGKSFSCDSGGYHHHLFFQLKDFTWLGFHNATGDITLSKPYKTSRGLYNAFWHTDNTKVFNLYKDSKTKPSNMNFERTNDGGLLVSTIHNGQREKVKYFGYTKKEAEVKFKQHLKSLK